MLALWSSLVDITNKIQEVVMSFPSADSLVLHIGTNDVCKRQSELLKSDFIQLFGVLKYLHYQVSISGPNPTADRVSRLLGLNTGLHSACLAHNVHFIDNFNLFWQRRDLFAVDGLHFNLASTRALSSNLSYHIHHHCNSTRVPKHNQTEEAAACASKL